MVWLVGSLEMNQDFRTARQKRSGEDAQAPAGETPALQNLLHYKIAADVTEYAGAHDSEEDFGGVFSLRELERLAQGEVAGWDAGRAGETDTF